MKSFLLAVLATCVSYVAFADEQDERVDRYVAEFSSKDGATIKIRITASKFVPAGHKLDMEDGTVDGNKCYGVDGTPTEETDVIDHFEVTFGKKVVRVPANQWQDCYNPTLRSPSINKTLPHYGQVGSIDVFISPDRSKVCISMGGYRSASAPYRVMWIVQNDDRGTRMIEAIDPG